VANDKRFVVKNGLTAQNIAFVDDIGTANNTITVSMLGSDTLSFSGDSGQLFSITDSQSGTIYAVNDISGVPSIEVDDDGTIRFAETFGNILIGTATDNATDKVQVNGDVLATNFKGALQGNANTASALETAVNITLSGAVTGTTSFDGSSNVTITTTATADPTLTIDGDASGSATFTNLGNATLTLTIADDSHNHIISNIDGLQTALNAKLDSSSYTAADVLSKLLTVDGATSNLDADLLDGQEGSYYLDYNNFTNTPTDTDTTYDLSIPATGVIRLSDSANSNDDITVVGSGATSVSSNTTHIIISSTDNNTTYSAGNGLTLTSTTFSVDVSGDSSLIANTSGLFIDDSTLSIATSQLTGDVALGTQTSGNYVATISGTANEIEVSGSGSETASVTIGLPNDVTIGNNLIVSGNLTVSGTTTTVNTETIKLADNIITLNSNEAGTPSQNAGIEVERGTSTNVILQWNETSDHWEIASGGTTGRILTTGDEGAGNGLDADTLDGQQGTYYLDYSNFTNTPTIPTVNDGTITISAGSGLTTGGAFTTNQSANETITINHADTSTQASLTALTGANVVSDIDLDGFGHVTSLATRAMTLADLGYTGSTNADNYGDWGLYTDGTFRNNVTSGENVNFLGGNSITVSYSATNNITINHADTSTQASVNNSGTTVIQDVTLDGFGHVTGLASTTIPTYTNSDVDSHLNTGTATTDQVLSWNGSDYDWVDGSQPPAYTKSTFTATASQTTFSVTYTVGYADVFLNGVKLSSLDYTATNGTSVVLATGATAGDSVEILAWNTSVGAYTDNNVDTHLNTGTATTNQILSWTGSDYDWVNQPSSYANADVDSHLNTGTATTNQILSWTGSDYDWINQSSSYSNADVDSHLNTGTATTNQILSWTGSDYDWVDQSAGGGGSVTTSDNAPVSPSDGDLWFNTNDASMYVYYNDGTSSQWVAISGPAGADGADGADVTTGKAIAMAIVFG